MPDEAIIELLEEGADATVRALLVELALDEQERYDHPRHSRADVEQSTESIAKQFVGENHVFVARDAGGAAVGLCWCVLFDPGTGLEGEVAEVFVTPEWRGRGLATRLLKEAKALFVRRSVTFACVWTRDDNPAAMAAYRAAGFTPTEQTVMTWLPLPR